MTKLSVLGVTMESKPKTMITGRSLNVDNLPLAPRIPSSLHTMQLRELRQSKLILTRPLETLMCARSPAVICTTQVVEQKLSLGHPK